LTEAERTLIETVVRQNEEILSHLRRFFPVELSKEEQYKRDFERLIKGKKRGK